MGCELAHLVDYQCERGFSIDLLLKSGEYKAWAYLLDGFIIVI